MTTDTTSRRQLVEPWRGREVLHVLLLWSAFTFVALIPIMALGLHSGDHLDGYIATTPAHALQSLSMIAASLAAVALVARRKEGSLFTVVGLRQPSRRWLIAAAVIPVALLADRIAVPLLLGGAAVDPSFAPAHVDLDGFVGLWLLVNIALNGLIVPVQEEVVYRGVIYGWLRPRARKTPAIIVSAVVFAVGHAGLGGMNIALAFVLGLVVAWMYERSGSLIPGIALHAGWNTTSTLAAALLVTT